MVIDIHTHIFPDQIAPKALSQLSFSAQIGYYHNGTYNGLKKSMQDNNIDISVLLPVATSPKQVNGINQRSYELNELFEQTGITSFGAIHPDCSDYKNIITEIFNHKLKGIKIHPVSQKVYFDDIRYLRILDYAFEKGLYVLTHGGYDISFPGETYAAYSHIEPVVNSFDCSRLILGHMGAFGEWDKVYEEILGRDIYIDTAFSLLPPKPYKKTYCNKTESNSMITTEEFKNIFPMHSSTFVNFVKKHGSEHILFGTDSPWDHQGLALQYILDSDIPNTDKENILYKNSSKILGL